MILVRRNNYNYGIRFTKGNGNILAYLSSNDGVILKKRDEVIFLAADKTRFAFTFGESQSVSTPTNNTINEHWIELDQEDLLWLTSNKITTIYLKDNAVQRMIGFSVAPTQQEALNKLAICFWKETKD
ncbi:MAG: hypothetical protein ACJASM_002508 [Salibacteraceae bacterium]